MSHPVPVSQSLSPALFSESFTVSALACGPLIHLELGFECGVRRGSVFVSRALDSVLFFPHTRLASRHGGGWGNPGLGRALVFSLGPAREPQLWPRTRVGVCSAKGSPGLVPSGLSVEASAGSPGACCAAVPPALGGPLPGLHVRLAASGHGAQCLSAPSGSPLHRHSFVLPSAFHSGLVTHAVSPSDAGANLCPEAVAETSLPRVPLALALLYHPHTHPAGRWAVNQCPWAGSGNTQGVGRDLKESGKIPSYPAA